MSIYDWYLCRMNEKLSIKQEKFCNYYLECGNASEAYRRAFSCDRMSDKSIWEKASILLAKAKVRARVDELRDEMRRRSDITKDEAVGILADIARANIVDTLVVRGGKDYTTILIDDVTKLPLSTQRAILSIKSSDKGYEVKLYNKIEAIEKLSKMLGWDAPVKQELTGKVDEAYTVRVVTRKEDLPSGDTDD